MVSAIICWNVGQAKVYKLGHYMFSLKVDHCIDNIHLE